MKAPCPGRVLLGSPERCAHNQEAFRYFLDVECARAARRRTRVLVALVSVRGAGAQLARPLAVDIFCGLWNGLREIDVVGWVREGRRAGAILPTGTHWPSDEESRNIARRLQSAICATVPADVADRVRVRVVPLSPN